jgi:TIR domain
VPGLSSRGIFLSYRREDAAPYARLLQFQLRERIPDAPVFMDMDSIEPGLDFAEVIREAIDSCSVLVALIGRQWATLADEEGRRRLDNPDDLVRFEVQAALERGVRVIPVLVDGARPIRPQQLPAELQKLARLNALELSYSRYQYDADRLLNLLQRILATAPGTGRQSLAAASVGAFTEPHDVSADGNALSNAERTAQSIPSDSAKASTLANIAEALAAIDPDRATRLIADAERIAQSITGEYWRARALAGIAEALAATDPDRAAQLIADAARAAQSVPGDSAKASALASIAEALAATDPDRAERAAQSIPDDYWRASALAGIAEALAATDPDRAERATQSIPGKYWKARALAGIARALAATDPDRAARLIADAERIAQSIPGEYWKARALAGNRAGTGSHRPGPRRPAHRRRGTHRPVRSRRLREGQRTRQHRGGTGSHRPGPRRTHRPVHHRRLREG